MKPFDTLQTLAQPFECVGYWWLPSDPEAVVAGTFSYAPETGCALELMGHLEGAKLNEQFPRVHGASPGGDRITLLNVNPTRTSFVQGTFPTAKYSCAIALVGNYHPPDDLSFSKSTVRFEHIEQWVHIHHVHQTPLKEGRGISFTIETGDHGKLSTSSGYCVTAQNGFNASSDDRRIRLDASTSLRIEPGGVSWNGISRRRGRFKTSRP